VNICDLKTAAGLPSIQLIVDALPSKFGHTPLKRGLWRWANRPTGWAPNGSSLLLIAGVGSAARFHADFDFIGPGPMTASILRLSRAAISAGSVQSMELY
jgi:hypothetical protein